MDTSISLGHFCEIHGPQALLTTTAYHQASTTTASPSANQPSNETGTSCANCSYNVPAATTAPPILRSRWRSTTFATTRAPSNPLLRDACTRALAVESLPRGQTSGSLTLVTDLATQGPKDARTVNVSHIFRLPDPRARGQRRSYAFVAVGSRSLFRAQIQVRKAFEAWGASIVELAEERLEEEYKNQREGGLRNSSVDHGMPVAPATPATVGSLKSLSSSATPSPPMSLGESTPPPPSPSSKTKNKDLESSPSSGSESQKRQRPQTSTPTAAVLTPVSSFLSAKSVDPDGYPRSSLSVASSALTNVPKTRSLAEIVGDEYFFVRLHAEFCAVLKGLIEKEIIEDGEGEDTLEACGSGSASAGSANDADEDEVVSSGDEDEGNIVW